MGRVSHLTPVQYGEMMTLLCCVWCTYIVCCYHQIMIHVLCVVYLYCMLLSDYDSCAVCVVQNG